MYIHVHEFMSLYVHVTDMYIDIDHQQIRVELLLWHYYTLLYQKNNIWKPQKVYNDGIYLVYTRHTTTSSVYLEYTWYIPVIWKHCHMTGIYQVYTICHIPGIYLVYTCHMKRHSTPGIPGIYPSHEIVRSARLQNLDCNAAAHRFWIARVFNVQRH